MFALVPALASAANDRLLFNMAQCCSLGEQTGLHNGPLTTADIGTGANQRSTGIALPSRSDFVLSPDGQLIATSSVVTVNGVQESVVSLARSDGTGLKEVKRNVSLVGFDPSGTKLVVGTFSAASPCPGLCLMTLDGSSLTTLSSQVGGGSLSPDGTKIVFAGPGTTNKTKEKLQLFVAKTDGSAPQQLTNFTSKTVPSSVHWEPKFGPGGQIAFWGESAGGEIWTIKEDGTGLSKVPIGAGNVWFSWTPEGKLSVSKGSGGGCGMYTVNPNGTSLTRLPLNEESSCSKPYPGFPIGTGAVPIGVYRQLSSKVDYHNYLASQFQPVLRFDSSEEWRPLNIESFFGESQHSICKIVCDATPIESAADLNRHRAEDAYINIAGHYEISGNEDTYHSPYNACTATGLRDCDTGARSAIYWRPAGMFGGYPFIDYWFFYRANYFSEEAGFHEADWEGVTIAPSLTGGTFDYAAFSQHGIYYSYLRDVLRCEDAPASSTPEAGTCGTESEHDGMRAVVFVANGSHANYTTPCSETVILLSCQQNGPGQQERGYDGAKRWGRAFDDPSTAWSSLLKMPDTGQEAWSDWPGKWGVEKAVGSPANQSISVECADHDNGEGCVAGPRGDEEPLAAALGLSEPISPGLSAVSCASWIGEGVSAAVCNPKALKRAVLAGVVGSNPELRVAVPGAQNGLASGRGIAQVAGNGVRDGSEITLSGRVDADATVWVRVNRGSERRPLLGKFELAPSELEDRDRLSGKIRLRVGVGQSPTGAPKLQLGSLKAQRVIVD